MSPSRRRAEISGAHPPPAVSALRSINHRNRLWDLATAPAAVPSPTLSPYLTALNRLADVATERQQAHANTSPRSVLWVLCAMLLLGNGLMAALVGCRSAQRVPVPVLAFGTWLVFAVLVDFDLPRYGWVQ